MLVRLEALLCSVQGILYQWQVALHHSTLHQHSEEEVIGFSALAGSPVLCRQMHKKSPAWQQRLCAS